MKQAPQLIVALDVDSRKEALRWVRLLYSEVRIFKVGLQLYTAYGPQIIKDIRKTGAEVFLDLKFNDIPNTMAAAAKEAVKSKAAMITVHALSGPEALEAVSEVCKGSKTKVFAVTILTSIGQHFLQDLGMRRGIRDEVVYLAKMAKRCGIDGIVCSAQEAGLVRKNLGRNFLIVTPGIRPQAAGDDQKRTATVKEAVKAGSNFLVVGRPILKSPCPSRVVKDIIAEFKN
jgi:orotidine-5'-phosphate decarboxylase